MKRHILGFAVFSFIVGATAIIYAMFNVVNVEKISVPAYPERYSSRTACWKMRREAQESNVGSPKIEQAVFNLNTKQFTWRLASPETELPIALHFFVKDADGTRYIGTERAMSSNLRDGTSHFTGSHSWLDNLDSDVNLYVIAEFVPAYGSYNKNFQPEFDASKATAVLFDYGR